MCGIDRDDLILYTITSDATLRVFLPVLDAPQHLQLHAAVDVFSSVPFSFASQTASSRIFWLSRDIMSDALTAALGSIDDGNEDGRCKRLREIKEENWDLFLRVLSDGSLIVQAVAVCTCSLTSTSFSSHVPPCASEHRLSPADTSQAIYPAAVRTVDPRVIKSDGTTPS